MSSELERIALLRARLGAPPAHVLVGIGDDAAVLAAPPGETLVWTVDAAVDRVHFRRDLMSYADIGARATAAAISDLAAMGATALGVLAALVLPDDVTDEDCEALAEGQRAAATQGGTAVIGGNLARGGELSITTTVLGSAPAPLRREGARPGDEIWLAGEVGLASAGLSILEAEVAGRANASQRSAAGRTATSAWLRPVARIAEGLAARGIARAAIDVSDGLARDLGHLARASRVRAVLEPSALVTPALAQAGAELRRDPLDLALHGGEDYALVVAAPPSSVLEGFRRIGVCEDESGAAADGPLVFLAAGGGGRTAVPERGWDHFSR